MSCRHSPADIQEDIDIHSCQECCDTQTDTRGRQRTHRYLCTFTNLSFLHRYVTLTSNVENYNHLHVYVNVFYLLLSGTKTSESLDVFSPDGGPVGTDLLFVPHTTYVLVYTVTQKKTFRLTHDGNFFKSSLRFSEFFHR